MDLTIEDVRPILSINNEHENRHKTVSISFHSYKVKSKMFGFQEDSYDILMLSVGGTGKFPGVVLGAFIITIGNGLLRDAGQYRLLILGVCVVLTAIFAALLIEKSS